jgi:hypothetical protein
VLNVMEEGPTAMFLLLDGFEVCCYDGAGTSQTNARRRLCCAILIACLDNPRFTLHTGRTYTEARQEEQSSLDTR